MHIYIYRERDTHIKGPGAGRGGLRGPGPARLPDLEQVEEGLGPGRDRC